MYEKTNLMTWKVLIKRTIIYILILKHKKIPLELSYITANVNGIASILEKDHSIPDPIILDAKFEQIKDEKFTRGIYLCIMGVKFLLRNLEKNTMASFLLTL